jgi:hypothetical protein
MTIRSRVASALSFAHLAGIGKPRSAEDDERREGESDEDYEKRTGKKADDSDPDKTDQDRDNGDSHAEDEDDKQREGESDEDYDKRMKSKAKAADEDDEDKNKSEDDDDEEMRGNSACAHARRRERARCAAIFASPAAGKNPVLAANLAFGTSMSRKEALTILEGTPAPAAALRPRQNPSLGAGGEPTVTAKQKAENSMVAALQKASGRK